MSKELAKLAKYKYAYFSARWQPTSSVDIRRRPVTKTCFAKTHLGLVCHYVVLKVAVFSFSIGSMVQEAAR